MNTIHVIIPCYNAVKYLEETIHSVLNQPYSAVKLILVDDGSTDETPVMCDKLAASIDRIHVIHQKNAGVSSARNTGIQYVLDTLNPQDFNYIAFLDADDCWEADFLSPYVVSLLASDYSIIGFRFSNCTPLMEKFSAPPALDAGLHTGGASSIWIHAGNHFASALYNCSFLSTYHLRFYDGLKYSEDKIFTMQCLYLADSVWLENRPMYMYRITTDSAMGTRPFGIPYYAPIVDSYLKSDKDMEKWTDDQRGLLTSGRVLASAYLMEMIDEHFQSRKSIASLKKFLNEHSGYVSLLEAAGEYEGLTPNADYIRFKNHPYSYFFRSYFKGIIRSFQRNLKKNLHGHK